ncbi:SusC/RagA family TonB-linked outer membrane protein [Pedobacter metabolipauper]|uniref:TonB-linked SusC/RagA family outer membrane protein n=1 Tax=Pedobacter metabolipauper TaxID=425513 RepID=A0A4R6T0G7_9SPHI|nr:TonB-dependent receptor [Pedobacter metabolipauper]TDQ11519.1 TonB-linked SusC/RagA family outer membrane protein [Pedobacter metabolipauper]
MKKSLCSNRVVYYCLLFMKYGIVVNSLIFCLSTMAIAKTSYSQALINKPVNIRLNQVTLENALDELSLKMGVKIAYRQSLVDKSLLVTQQANGEALKDVLAKILKPYKLTYYLVDNVVVIARQSNQIPVASELREVAAEIEISGTVRDTTGAVLPGVSVSVKDRSTGAVTDLNGNYRLRADANSTLIFNYIGFIRQDVPVQGRNSINIRMQSSVLSLQDVVVVGYGTIKKGDVTGSVGKVNLSDAQKAPVRSFDEFLAGRVAGLQVSSVDGQPGSAVNIVIRGNNSITQDNSPLIVIDGFPTENPDLNMINPDDIESIEILKDASATAIYGARGANGVLMVTTKKGKSGAPVLNFNAYYGNQSTINRLDLMDPYEFVKYQIERTPSVTDTTAPSALYLANGRTLDYYRNVEGIDWQDMMLRDAPFQNYSLSLSGGNQQTRYALSGSINDQDGVIINSFYKRYQGRAVVDQTVNAKLKAGLNANYSYLQKSGVSPSESGGNLATTLLYSVYGSRPVNAQRDETGIEDELFDPSIDLSSDYRINPIINQENLVRNTTTRNLMANAYAEYSVLPELTLRVTGGIYSTQGRFDAFNNSKTLYGSVRTTWGSSYGVNGYIQNRENNSWVNENTLTWAKSFNQKHNFNVVGGVTEQGGKTSVYQFGASNLPNESLGLSGLDEGNLLPVRTIATTSNWRMMSFLGRFNYNYDSKYYFTASYRADGSSKFPVGNRWAYFPSAALSWRIINEDFARNLPALSDAKLRASFGLTGNNRVSDYSYLPSYGLPIANTYVFNNNYQSSIIPLTPGNNDLKWETTRQLDFGIDLGFFKDRITLTADVYSKRTYDLLLNASLPFSTGYTSAFKNIGSMNNEGLEFTLGANPVRTRDFNWNASFNISFNRNKVLELTEGQQSLTTAIMWDNNWQSLPAYISQIGKPVGNMYGLVWDGVYQYADFNQDASGNYVLKDEITTNGNTRSRIQPGDIKYQDQNGDKVVDASDYTIIGKGLPVHTGGFNNTFTYKNFDLNVFFQWSYGNDIQNINRLVFEGNAFNKPYLNQLASYENRWAPENTESTMYRANGFYGGGYSSRTVEDGSFLRLKTLALGYSLPKSVLKSLKISNLRVYASAQNVVTWTNYSGSDPEVNTYNSVLTPGFDFSSYPRARTMVLGINLTF